MATTTSQSQVTEKTQPVARLDAARVCVADAAAAGSLATDASADSRCRGHHAVGL
jgi:hypothetical protein